MKTKVIYSLLLVLLFSCGKESAQEEIPFSSLGGRAPSTATDADDDTGAQDQDQPNNTLPTINKLRWYKTTWQKEWSHTLFEDLKESSIDSVVLRESDLRKLGCSSYNSSSVIEKHKFWLVFFASIAANESAFNPALRYYERSLKEYSEGLLQLSLSDKSTSPLCKSISQKSILRGSSNLRCGLGIMQRQLRGSSRRALEPGTLFPRRPYYWSVLTRQESQTKVINFFKGHLKQLSFCY